jgi:hypothetical protein
MLVVRNTECKCPKLREDWGKQGCQVHSRHRRSATVDVAQLAFAGSTDLDPNIRQVNFIRANPCGGQGQIASLIEVKCTLELPIDGR